MTGEGEESCYLHAHESRYGRAGCADKLWLL